MAIVVFDQVRKTFRDKLAEEPVAVFESLSLRFESPTIVSIVGPNGVGKTTFLRLLAGILGPDQGKILIDGTDAHKCRIGYVPQSNPVFPWRRIIDDIAIPLEIAGITREQRHAYVQDLVRQFSFDLPLRRRTYGLSGGQRQLVNLCRALLGPEPPKVLLLDEPFASLDPVAREEFLAHLQNIRRDFSLLVFLTTHQLDYAVLASDTVLPFFRRPVALNDGDSIAVNLPYPRTPNTRTGLEFQATLLRIEKVFRTKVAEVL